ncbi:MAG TPA: 50S ribosomal protein L35 [Acidimicrobiales bacterium]|jgi:large subunit ribosomal protein L35|nr:50S ribosomal protein L35 [Acidimicrobiales bacterium]
MPKMKTDRGAAARFKVTGSGKILRRQANRSHLMEKKSSVRARRLGRSVELAAADRRQVRRLLGI